MPAEDAQFLPSESLLSFDDIEALVRCIVPIGIRNFRLTGGEPLLRRDLHLLVERLSAIEGIEDLALTTNGMLLRQQVGLLAKAGLRRINISLDTLSEAVFERISRRKGLHLVLEGIEAARQHPGLDIKLNSLVLRDVNLAGVVELVDFASERDLPLRFIEFMPLDAERAWTAQRMVGGEELREHVSRAFGALVEVPSSDPARPSRDFVFASGRPGRLGFIDSVSKPFCSSCDRLRLTADGKIRNCLFGSQEWDVAQLLSRRDVAALHQQLRDCVQAKHPAHGIADPDFQPPQRPMYQIGG